MRIVECDQGSGEWLRARCGRITASGIHAATATRKRGGNTELAARASYRSILARERIYNVPATIADWWPHGTNSEPEARMAYGMAHGVFVEQVGFVIHPSMDFSGASPDGLVGSAGGVEIKCFKTERHEELLRKAQKFNHEVHEWEGYIECFDTRLIPTEYEPQIVWNMVCCERQWWDFWAWHGTLPALKVRLLRDEQRIDLLTDAVRTFNEEVQEEIKLLTSPIPTLTDQLRASLEVA